MIEELPAASFARLEQSSLFEVLEAEPLKIGRVARPESRAVNSDPGILCRDPLAAGGEDKGAGAGAIVLRPEQRRLAQLLDPARDLERPLDVPAEGIDFDHPNRRH